MAGSALLPSAQDCLSLHVAWTWQRTRTRQRDAPALAGTGLGLPYQHRAKPSRNIPQ